ncbi:MAG: hypothetical protein PF637_06605 [Spirochaetes bacterium]|nr:hypothetical protein [Spirochaetota bacterium]
MYSEEKLAGSYVNKIFSNIEELNTIAEIAYKQRVRFEFELSEREY